MTGAMGALTAVVLTWRDTERTRACVDALLTCDLITRVVVVDNESTGALRSHFGPGACTRVDLVEAPWNLGFSAGLNRGLQHPEAQAADFILVINNDALIDPGSVALLLDSLATDPKAMLVAPRIHTASGEEEKSWGRVTSTMGIDRNVLPNEADYFTWACVMFRTELLSRIGYLDERFFMYYEDVEYGLRMRHSHSQSKLVDEARAIHSRSASSETAGAIVAAYAAHGVVVLARSRNNLLWGLVRVSARLIRAILLGSPKRARAVFVGARIAMLRPGSRGYEAFGYRCSSEESGHRVA